MPKSSKVSAKASDRNWNDPDGRPMPRRVSSRRKQKESTQVPSHMGFRIRMDGAIIIRIERNKRNNTLSPTPHHIEQVLLTSTYPVVIDLWEDQPDKKADHVQRTELVQYFHVFLNFLHRWKGIRIWAPWVTPEIFHGKQFLPSPLLESIELGGPPSCDTFKCWLSVTILYQETSGPESVSPSALQKFTIRDRRKGSKMLSFRAPLATFVPIKQLTTILMENLLSDVDCNCILSEIADNIVNCAFTNITAVTVNKPGGLGYMLVTCSQLKSLYLGNNVTENRQRGSKSLHALLHHTIAPQLLALTLCHGHLVHADVSTFIAQSACSLQALELHLISLVPEELFNVLAKSPNLRVLKIFGDENAKPQGFSSVICENLTSRTFNQFSSEDYNILCPALEMLLVDENAISELPAGQISHMVESRINRSALKFVWIATKSDPPQVWDTQMTVGTTLLSQEDPGKFRDLRRTSKFSNNLHLIIDYDCSACCNRSGVWNSEVSVTLKTLEPILTEAKEPTAFEYRGKPHESSSKADQQQIPAASRSTHALTFGPVGERVTGSRDEIYGAVENILQQGPSGQNSGPEPHTRSLFTPQGDAEMAQLSNMTLEGQSLSHAFETGYETPPGPLVPQHNTWGVDVDWIPDPYQKFGQNANQNDYDTVQLRSRQLLTFEEWLNIQ